VSVNDSGGALSTTTISVVVHPAVTLTLNITPRPVDLGQLVNFSANVSGGTAPFVYTWAFGDGGTGGDLANISHIYTTNGPFWPAVTVIDAAGQVVTTDQQLIVALNVSILSNGTLGAAPFGVGFDSHVTGGEPGYRYAWQFGDGATSSQPDPVHVYDLPGQYDARLTVTDAVGATAQSGEWTVFVAPGGGTLALTLAETSANISLGAVETVTAEPRGGAGAYTLSWSSLPAGCTQPSALTLYCAPSESGIYAVSASLRDGPGAFVTATTTFSVGHIGPPGTLQPGGGPEGGFGLSALALAELIAGALGVVAVTAGAAFVIGTRRGSGARDTRNAHDPYERYRRAETPPNDVTLDRGDAATSGDPLSDLL
ncbi:MAG: PKD domain-containing protein, partial [Thermoplasmata archaeon]|nr:PKD domain-containing protein [Thermoplasmata archaeon]